MSERLKVEVQDSEGNVFYMHTAADVVFMEDGTTVEEKINQLNADLSNMALDLNIIKESLPSKTLPKDKKIIDSLDALKGNFIFYLNSYDNYGGCDVPGKENYFGIVFAAGAAYSQLICMGNLTGNLYTRVKINGSWSGWYTK